MRGLVPAPCRVAVCPMTASFTLGARACVRLGYDQRLGRVGRRRLRRDRFRRVQEANEGGDPVRRRARYGFTES